MAVARPAHRISLKGNVVHHDEAQHDPPPAPPTTSIALSAQAPIAPPINSDLDTGDRPMEPVIFSGSWPAWHLQANLVGEVS